MNPTFLNSSSKALFLLCFLFQLSYFSFSSPTDSLVKLSEITYNSEFEKEYIRKILVKKDLKDFLPLFLGTDRNSNSGTLTDIEGRITNVYSKINSDGLDKKTEAKKIKLIYTSIHSFFLKKYALENNFSEIFQTGQYNCLSATALFALFLEKFQIPYTIKETPNHVFLVAYPQTYKILIETTDPRNGFFQFNEVFIGDYIDDLRKAKLISEEEFSTKSKSDLFNQYFFREEDINLRQLLGLQYYNLALYKHQKENYKEAFESIQKAYLFYPTDGIRYLLKNLLLVLLSRTNYDDPDDIKYFIYLTRFKVKDNAEVDVDLIENEFSRITQKQLVSKGNFDGYNKTYQSISHEVTDSVSKIAIDYIYNYETARAVLTTDRALEIDENLKILYALKPDNINVHAIITSYIGSKLSTINNPNVMLKALKKYSDQYKFLTSNNKIAWIFIACYLELAAQSYLMNELKTGDFHLQTFEDFVKGKDESIIMEQQVEKSYSEAAAAYYRKGNSSKAKSLIRKGLEYAPDNFNLKLRLRSLN